MAHAKLTSTITPRVRRLNPTRPAKKKSPAKSQVTRVRRANAVGTSDQPAICYDAQVGVLESNDPALNDQPVTLNTIDQRNGIASVTLADGRTLRVPLCSPLPLVGTPIPVDGPDVKGPKPPGRPPRPPGRPPGGGGGGGGRGECCVDLDTMRLVCANLDDPRHGLTVDYVEQVVPSRGYPNGVATVYLTDPTTGSQVGARFPVCPPSTDTPPPPTVDPPSDCCYDAATGLLRCDSEVLAGGGTYNGLEVSLEAMNTMGDGTVIATVSHPDLQPSGYLRVPVCDDPVPPDCCYNGQTGRIECESDADLNGTPASVVTTFTYPDGTPGVSVAWDGGGTRLPLCTHECPPQLCCVNVDTMTFVCPGGGAINGQPADVADVIVDADGFSHAVLSDGTRVPTCGKKCPPPRACPPGEGCPPGLWLSPDGECMDPPTCEPPPGVTPPPPGFPPPPGGGTPPPWMPPGGQPPCVPPWCCDNDECEEPPPVTFPVPEDPRTWWKDEDSCCEFCALGLSCTGDCGCDGEDHGDAAVEYPTKRSRNGRAHVRVGKRQPNGTHLGTLVTKDGTFPVRVQRTGKGKAKVKGIVGSNGQVVVSPRGGRKGNPPAAPFNVQSACQSLCSGAYAQGQMPATCQPGGACDWILMEDGGTGCSVEACMQSYGYVAGYYDCPSPDWSRICSGPGGRITAPQGQQGTRGYEYTEEYGCYDHTTKTMMGSSTTLTEPGGKPAGLGMRYGEPVAVGFIQGRGVPRRAVAVPVCDATHPSFIPHYGTGGTLVPGVQGSSAGRRRARARARMRAMAR